jgi:hypothetical protein
VRYRFKTNKAIKSILLRVHGDGKQYQFRIKSNSAQYYSYIYPFQTNGEWQDIEIPLQEFYLI